MRKAFGFLFLGVVAAYGAWSVVSMRAESVSRLVACVDAEPVWLGWQCEQGIRWLHLRQAAEVAELSDEAGVYYTAQVADLDAANRLTALFIERGVDINASNKRSGLNWTALHSAAFANNASAVSILLKNGADPTIRDAQGRTALDIVAEAKFRAPETDFSQVIHALKRSPKA